MHPTGDLALVTEGKRITLIKKIVEELKNIATDGGEDIGKDVQRTVVQLELDVYNSATSMGEYFNALGTRTTRLRTQLLQTAARAAGNTVAAVAAATTEPDAEEEVGGAHVVPGRGPVAQLLSDQPTRPQVGAQALNQSPSQPQQQPLHQHLQQPETAQTLQQQQQQQQGLQQQEQPQGAVGGMEGEVEEKGSHSTEGSCTVAIGRNGGSAAAATAVGVVSGAAGTPGRGPIQQMHMSNPAAEVVPYETLRLPGQDPASINEVANGARDPDAAVTTPESFGPAGPYGGAIGGPGTGLVPETGVHAAGGGIVFLYFSTSPRDEARRGDSGDRSSSGSGSVSFKPIPSELEPSQQQQPQPGPGPARLLPSHEFTGDRGEVGEFGGSGDGRDGEGDATRKLVQSQGATTSSWPQSAAMPPALHGTRHLAVVPSAEKLSVPVTTEWGGGSVQQGTTERLPPHHTPTVNDHATLPPQQLPPQLPQQQDVGEGQLLRTSSLTKAYLRLRPRAYQTASAGGAGLRDESGYINGPFECLTSTAGPLGPILRTASSPARAMDWLQPKQHQHQQQESLPLTQYGVPNRPRLEPSSQSDGAGATAQLQLRRRVSGSGDGRGGDRADVEDPTLPRVPYTFIRHASDSQVLAAREEQGYERWHGLTSREHRLGQPVLRLQPLRRSSSEVSPDGGAVRSKARTQVPVGRPSEAAVTAPAYGSSGGDCILELARLEGVLEGMQGPGSKVMPVAAVAATAMMTAPSPAAPPPRVPQATASFLGNSESAMVTSGPDILNVDTDMVDAFGCRGPPVAPAAPVPPPHTGPKSQLGPPGAHSFLGPTPQPMEPPSANRRLPDGPHQQVLLQQQQRLCLYPQQQGHNLQEQQHEAQQQRMEQLRFQQQQESRKASTLTSRDDFRQSLLPLQHRPSPSAGHTLSAEYSLIHSVSAALPPEGSAHGAGDHPGAFPQHQHQHQHRHRHRHQAEPSGLAPQLAALGNIWQPPSQPLPPPPQQQQEQLQQQQRLHQPQPGIEPHLEIRPAAGQRQTQLTQQPVHGQFPPLQLQQLLPAQQPSQVQHQQHHQSSQPHYSQTQQVAPGTFPVPPRRAKSPRASLEIRSPAMSALQLSLIGTTNGGGGGTRGSDGGGGGLGGRDSGVIPGNAVLHSSTSQMQGQGQRPLPPWSAGTLGAAVGTSAPGGGDAVFNIDQLVVRQVQETTAAVFRSQRMSSSSIAALGPSGHPLHSSSPQCRTPVLTLAPGSTTTAPTPTASYCGGGGGGASSLPPTFAAVPTASSASAASMSHLNAPAITLTIPRGQCGGGGNSSWNMTTSYSDRATAPVAAPFAVTSTAAVAVSTTGNNARPARSSWTTGQLHASVSVTPSPTDFGPTLAPTLGPLEAPAVSTVGPDGSIVAGRSHAAGFEMVDAGGGRVSGSCGGWTSCGTSAGGVANVSGTLPVPSLDVPSSCPTQVQEQRLQVQPQSQTEPHQFSLRPSVSQWPLQKHHQRQPQQTEPWVLPPRPPPPPPLGVESMDTGGSLGPNTAASLYDSSTDASPLFSATSNVQLAGGSTVSSGNLGFQGLSLQHQGMLQSTAAGVSASNLVDGSGGGGAACGVSDVFGGSPRAGSPMGHQIGILPFQGGLALVSPAQSGAAGLPSAPLTPISLGTDGGTTAPAAAATVIPMAGWGGSDVSAAAGSQPQLTGVWQSAFMELQGGPNHGALMPYGVAAMDVTVEGGGERDEGIDPASGLDSAVLAEAGAEAIPSAPSNEGNLLADISFLRGMATGSSSSGSGVGGDLSGSVVF